MMLARAWLSLDEFFRRPFLERLVLYLFLSYFCTKVVFELVMGQWHFHTSKQQQYFFFSFIAIDYVVTWKQVYAVRFRATYITLFAVFFLFIALYGVAIGVLVHNRPFEIFNDTVPILIMSLNLLRLQSERAAWNESGLYRLARETSVLSMAMCLFGAAAVLIGRPSTYALNGIPMAIYAALILSFFLSNRPLPAWIVTSFVVVFLFTLQDLNRTNMLFIATAVAVLLARTFLRTPPKALLAIVLLASIGGGVLFALPSDSKTYNRLHAIVSADESSPKTSVGERETEYASIKQRLANQGLTIDTLGMGHGALYEMRAANSYKKDYGHAHFSWALFKLRYGNLGYGLCVLLGAILLVNAALHVTQHEPLQSFAFLLSMVSFIYLFTFVNFIFLLSGLAFLSTRPRTVHVVRMPSAPYQTQPGHWRAAPYQLTEREKTL